MTAGPISISSSFESGAGRRSLDRLIGVDAVDVEPGGELLTLEDRRHAAVQPAHERVGRGCDDEGGVDFAAGRVAIGLVEAGEPHEAAIDRADEIGALRRAARAALPPFVKAVGDDETTPPRQRGAKARPHRQRLGAGVDEERKGLRILGEARQEPPAHQLKMPLRPALRGSAKTTGIGWVGAMLKRGGKFGVSAKPKNARTASGGDVIA